MGYVDSWVLSKDEASRHEKGERALKKLPRAVFVRFYTREGKPETWRIPGLSKEGLYPIGVKRASCYLDKGRQHPVLRITRSQIPLAPAFAMTAQGSQGQTLRDGAIVDLRIGRGTSPMASYVALTRVERRSQLLIYRPFERELFAQGPQWGPALLLSMLRGEVIDWKSIEEECMPRTRCAGCGNVEYKSRYAPQQWTRKDKQPYCKDCVQRKCLEGVPLQCTNCYMWRAKDAFRPTQQHPSALNTRVCEDCIETRKCQACGENKDEKEFTKREWQHASRSMSAANA